MLLILGIVMGAALPTGGFFLGYWIRGRMEKGKTEAPPKRTRKPKCYVIEPKDFGEETAG